jgi:hypothetical protein
MASHKNQHIAIFCNHLAKLLQKIIASQKNQHIASHATIFCNHLAKLLQKIMASHKNQHIAIFCNHLAKLLQKIVASQKKTSTSHRMLLSFVTTLQDDTEDSSNCDVMGWFFWDAMIFCDNFAR